MNCQGNSVDSYFSIPRFKDDTCYGGLPLSLRKGLRLISFLCESRRRALNTNFVSEIDYESFFHEIKKLSYQSELAVSEYYVKS